MELTQVEALSLIEKFKAQPTPEDTFASNKSFTSLEVAKDISLPSLERFLLLNHINTAKPGDFEVANRWGEMNRSLSVGEWEWSKVKFFGLQWVDWNKPSTIQVTRDGVKSLSTLSKELSGVVENGEYAMRLAALHDHLNRLC